MRKLEVRSKWDKLYVVVLDCSSVNALDFTCTKMLMRVVAQFKSRGIAILFGNWNGASMRTLLDGMDFFDEVDEGDFFLSMERAIEAAVRMRNEAREKEGERERSMEDERERSMEDEEKGIGEFLAVAEGEDEQGEEWLAQGGDS